MSLWGERIAVIGMGYVGLPLAVAFTNQGAAVTGFDTRKKRLNELRSGRDSGQEFTPHILSATHIDYTDDTEALAACDVFIVCVPTPLDAEGRPDLSDLEAACQSVGAALRAGALVVYESTVFPGVTEDICIPILEKRSGLKAGQDFMVAYSPERINPGDQKHCLRTVTKVVAGHTPAALARASRLYGSIVDAGVYAAPTIRVAEATKLAENVQRDVNIALMNEMARIFGALGLDATNVFQAARTKWNFHPYLPGLVGGHCIGVDPMYLAYCARQTGIEPSLVLTARNVNDSMPGFIAQQCVDRLVRQYGPGGQRGRRVTVLGVTFKENLPDIRNTPARALIQKLQAFGIVPQVVDPWAEPEDVVTQLGVPLCPDDGIEPSDGVILAVAHDEFVTGGWQLVDRCLGGVGKVVIDVKAVLDPENMPPEIDFFRL
ncbi:UDP-N-acetyl-D-glucosamine 6-dehydrogenase [Komagataeibacter europaeus]|uniref:UDP-N-acetyl-D-glucosamine 6-dehydrogenase n=1 Tax=Komagataeibacter europaeus TaxID=33995 RepID=A0A0M0EHX2_KOMEU|nr:nucleotide sugar dehydrogenase [Komagataeibacter europaeus]KON64845.1 UDP-N-acetyl-D-glucosamine 6-dehydrogenase [Komagataeibacter europaeus]